MRHLETPPPDAAQWPGARDSGTLTHRVGEEMRWSGPARAATVTSADRPGVFVVAREWPGSDGSGMRRYVLPDLGC